MPRVKRGTIAHKRKKNILKNTKGYRHGRKSKVGFAKEAILHAGKYALRDRKAKKRVFRRLWQTKISMFLKEKGSSYNVFIQGLKKNKIEIDRKILAEMIQKQPALFEKILEESKK